MANSGIRPPGGITSAKLATGGGVESGGTLYRFPVTAGTLGTSSISASAAIGGLAGSGFTKAFRKVSPGGSTVIVGAGKAAARGRHATQAERDRWNDYLLKVADRRREGAITDFQARCVLDVWQRAIEVEPNVMYPTAITTDDGGVVLSWNPPGRELSIEVHAADVEWFHTDDETSDSDGSEDPVATLPPRVFTYLRSFRR